MRRVPIWAMLCALLLSACLPGLNDEEPTQTPIIITATPPPATSTPIPSATAEPTATTEPQPTPTLEPTASPTLAPAPTVAQQSTATQAPAATATTPAQASGDVELLQAGFSQTAPGEVVSWGIIIQNTNQTMALENPSFGLVFYDASGMEVETDATAVPVIFPGERTGFGGSTTVNDGVAVVRMEVLIEPGTPTSGEFSEGFTVDTVTIFANEFFPKVTALVNNPLDSLVTDLRVSLVTFDADGNVNGGDFSFLAAAAPAGQTGVDVSIDSTDIASAEMFASLTFISEIVESNPETDALVTKFGFGQEADGLDVGWGALIQNPNVDQTIVQLEAHVWFLDAEGRVLHAGVSFLSILPAGRTTGYGDDFVFIPDDTVVETMHIVLRPGRLEAAAGPEWFTVDNATYVADEFSPEVVGTVNNPFPTNLEDLYVSAIAFDADDNIIGGGLGFLNRAPANGSAEVEVDLTTSALPARVEIHVIPSTLTEF